jgi:hypothetical protein
MPKRRKKKEKKVQTFDLQVLPAVEGLVERKALPRPVDPRLPDVYKGAVLLLIGKIKSGKSTKILNFFCNPNFYKDVFDHIFVISNTIHQDKTLEPLCEIATVYDHYTDAILEDIIEYQKSFEDHMCRPRTAIVLDDVVNSVKKQGSAIESLATRSRHVLNGGLVIMASQQFNKVSVPMRTNATNIIISKTTSKKERDNINESYGDNFCDGAHGEKTFLNALDYATSIPWGFLHLNFDDDPCPSLWSGFDEQLYPEGKFAKQPGLFDNEFEDDGDKDKDKDIIEDSSDKK